MLLDLKTKQVAELPQSGGAAGTGRKLMAPKLSPDASLVLVRGYVSGNPQLRDYQYQAIAFGVDAPATYLLSSGATHAEASFVSNTEVALIANSGHLRIKTLQGRQIGPMRVDRLAGY
jgi:hypothetical protein